MDYKRSNQRLLARLAGIAGLKSLLDGAAALTGVFLSGDNLLLLPDGEEPPPSGRIRYRLVLLRSHQTKKLLKSGS